ncbi:hypothetical protein ANACOL_03190 [Anaerotruncus colihominis DSM 17241]|uniref:Uncharacterized protein n=1 Tax=Anaerotruncus colihominis DSM 17241 TaxID=445972 RepID=B0PDN6_9FIRM|nr:hypothetical protein ANACOL_03190 [Anaerotruncus colihominis DSM 17241]
MRSLASPRLDGKSRPIAAFQISGTKPRQDVAPLLDAAEQVDQLHIEIDVDHMARAGLHTHQHRLKAGQE